MIPTIKYLLMTIKHKYFVFVAGRKTRAPVWRLVIHDWTKFLPCEAPYYGRQFFGDRGDKTGFARAWIHHQNSNPHHWEYWQNRSIHNRATNPIDPDDWLCPMPEWAVREMVADWMGASRAYTGHNPTDWNWPWLRKNLVSRVLPNIHPKTRLVLMRVLKEVLGAIPPDGLNTDIVYAGFSKRGNYVDQNK